MNRSTVTVKAPITVATLGLALATALFGHSALTGHPGPTELTPVERQAVIKIIEAEASRAAAFTECPSGPVYPTRPC